MTRQLDGTGLKRLHREWRQGVDGRLALILDSVQGPHNVGGIVRTAAAYRVDHIWLAASTAEITAPGARKVSLGTERYVTWGKVERATDAIGEARGDGYQVVALELADDAAPLHALALPADVCLIIGNEDHGISPAGLAASDAVAFLPQLGRVGSLNVAAAAAIALYEVRRRAWAGG